jgi:predicted CopG family antitoxin
MGNDYLHRMEPETGCYYVVDNEKYPDAYIKIKKEKAVFSDIDLNEIFRKEIAEDYIESLENQNGKLSEEEKEDIINSIDLNKQFCEEFQLDFESFSLQTGINTYDYRFGCVAPYRYLGYTYNKKEKTILVKFGDKTLLFKRK